MKHDFRIAPCCTPASAKLGIVPNLVGSCRATQCYTKIGFCVNTLLYNSIHQTWEMFLIWLDAVVIHSGTRKLCLGFVGTV
jgi:hypothetical protein